MYDHILVPLDGGPHGAVVARIADLLADRWDADIEVVSILAHGEETDEREQEIARHIALLEHRPEMTVRYVTYTVADSIADEFEEHENTLIVMGTAARSRAGALLESVAEDVLDYTNAPALLVGPRVEIDVDWPGGEMFVCTDGTDESEAIVPDAAAWATALDLHTWVLTAADPKVEMPPDSFETGHVSRVARKIGKITGRTVDFDVVHDDDPAKGVLRYIADRHPALIALATHGRTGWERLVQGSVAMELVHDAPCPVLARLE